MYYEQRMSRNILRVLNALFSVVVFLCLTVAGLYAAYALWDNNRVYTAAGDVQADMIKIKPMVEEDGGASFEELLAINKDVCAWVTLDNTKIDYPILHGETNLSYINTDVYGDFSLAGSIFLDTRNSRDFSDAYSLLYGHHMENSLMFGDLDLYKDKKFFDANSTGSLILPDKSYKLEIFACLSVNSGDDTIFGVERWRLNINGLVSYAEENSMHLRQATLDKLKAMEAPQVLALSTCSSDYTDARTIVLAVMQPYQLDESGGEIA